MAGYTDYHKARDIVGHWMNPSFRDLNNFLSGPEFQQLHRFLWSIGNDETLILVDGLNMANDVDMWNYLVSAQYSDMSLFNDIFQRCNIAVSRFNELTRDEKIRYIGCVITTLAGYVSRNYKFLIVFATELDYNNVQIISDTVAVAIISGSRYDEYRNEIKLEVDDLLLLFVYSYCKITGVNVKIFSLDRYPFAKSIQDHLNRDFVAILQNTPGSRYEWSIGGRPTRGFFYFYGGM